MLICKFSTYNYPNFKSRLKSYFIKLLRLEKGLVWHGLIRIVIGENEAWKYWLEINQEEFIDRIQVLILEEFKEVR